MAHQKVDRADKFRVDRLAEDKEGLAPRLNELIRWTRYTFLVLMAIGGMVALFFIRDAVTVILRLLGV